MSIERVAHGNDARPQLMPDHRGRELHNEAPEKLFAAWRRVLARVNESAAVRRHRVTTRQARE